MHGVGTELMKCSISVLENYNYIINIMIMISTISPSPSCAVAHDLHWQLILYDVKLRIKCLVPTLNGT